MRSLSFLKNSAFWTVDGYPEIFCASAKNLFTAFAINN